MKLTQIQKFVFYAILVIICFSFSVAPLNWKIDPNNAITFKVKYMFGQTCNGRIGGLQGTIDFDTIKPEQSVFDVTLDVPTLKTGNAKRDAHLQKEEYFNAAEFPQIKFKSTHVDKTVAGYTVTGALTIKAITKQISIPFKFISNRIKGRFEGAFEINRLDYGVGKKTAFLKNNISIRLSIPVSEDY